MNRNFGTEDTGMGNKDLKGCSRSTVIREIQIKNHNEILLGAYSNG